MMKLGGLVHCTKISAEFQFGGHHPLGAHPKNVALGYDVGKISAGCLGWLFFIYCVYSFSLVCFQLIW